MKKRFLKCPVCKSDLKSKPRTDLLPHPYTECGGCGLYYQENPVEKVYEAHHESRGDLMSDADKAVNNALAANIVDFWKKNSHPSSSGFKYHLDIGTKYPYLGHCIQNHGKDNFVKSVGVDGIDLVGTFGEELGVKVIQTDFESPIFDWEFPENDPNLKELFIEGKFNIITLVHCVEHFYKPIQTLQRIHNLGVNQATLFIRCPDSETPGIERDFTQGHYEIHPLVWNLNSILRAFQVCGEEGYRFELLKTYAFSGQRDYWVRIQK